MFYWHSLNEDEIVYMSLVPGPVCHIYFLGQRRRCRRIVRQHQDEPFAVCLALTTTVLEVARTQVCFVHPGIGTLYEQPLDVHHYSALD